MAWLLDTNILSELRRSRPEPMVVDFVTAQPLADLYVSAVSLAEIRFGIEILPQGDQRVKLNDWLSVTVRPMFEGRVLEITEGILFRWRLLIEDGRKIGHTYSQPDLMLAATALEHSLTMVTRNVSDFAGLGLVVVNPWDRMP